MGKTKILVAKRSSCILTNANKMGDLYRNDLGRICICSTARLCRQEWGILKGERIWRSDSVALSTLSVRFQRGDETPLGPCVSTKTSVRQHKILSCTFKSANLSSGGASPSPTTVRQHKKLPAKAERISCNLVNCIKKKADCKSVCLSYIQFY